MFTRDTKRALPALLLSLLLPVFVAPARANSDAQTPAVVVHFADLNLATDDGVSKLYRRLQSAAHQVCRTYEGRDLSKVAKWRTCYKQALDSGVTQIKLPTLLALHRKAMAGLRVS